MSRIPGKRKRPVEAESASKKNVVRADDSSDGEDAARALFRRAFEAKFKPLREEPALTKSAPTEQLSEELSIDSGTESDWSAFTHGDDNEEVEVVEHVPSSGNVIDELMSKNGRKSYMSSRPPQFEDAVAKVQPHKTPKLEAGDGGADDLKNDLALQRLLKESHLLDPSSFNGDVSVPQGKNRLKALDMRVRDLGGKTSILQQAKMPMSHRRGIAAKATRREAARRKEAVENGIILEKPTAATKIRRQRDRGIGGPTVGKFKGGTLKISARDVKNIESSNHGSDRRHRRR